MFTLEFFFASQKIHGGQNQCAHHEANRKQREWRNNIQHDLADDIHPAPNGGRGQSAGKPNERLVTHLLESAVLQNPLPDRMDVQIPLFDEFHFLQIRSVEIAAAF